MLRGLEWRWTLRLALSVFVTAQVAGAVVALRAQDSFRAAVDQRAAAVGRGIARRCRQEVLAGLPGPVARCLASAWEEPDVARVAVEGPAGVTLVERRFGAAAPARTVRYAVAAPDGAVAAFVVVEVRQRTLDRATAVARRDGLGAAVLFLVLGTLLAWIATRRIVRPLRALAVAEASIAAGDRTAHIPTEGAPELRDLADAFHTMVAAVRDRDERLTARADELQASLDQVARLEREKRALTAMIVHDLRSPVSSALAAVKVLDVERLSPGDGALLGVAAERLEGALGLAGELLEIARLEEIDAGAALARTPVDLAAMCRRLAAAPWPGPAGAPVTVALDVADGEHTVDGDAGLLERAIGNLLSNAARHGGGAGPVVLRLRAGDAGMVHVEVEDQGPGVPAAERARIFEPFARGAAAHGAGSGLGLALCARVAAAHGGRVWVVDAAAHRGARFVLELPEGGAT